MIRCTREAFEHLVRDGRRSVVMLAAVTVSVFFAGSLFLFMQNLMHITSTLESEGEIKVFLEDGADPEKTADLIAGEFDAFVTILPKEEGLEQLLASFEEREHLENLREDNPLNDVLTVRVQTPEEIPETAAAITEYQEVEDTAYREDYYEKMSAVISVVRLGGAAAGAVSAGGSVFLAGAMIGTAVTYRCREVDILKMTGASASFIRGPYLMEGFLLGAGGGLTASLFVHYIYQKLYGAAGEMFFLPFLLPPSFWWTAGGMVCFGILLGTGGAMTGLRRCLISS